MRRGAARRGRGVPGGTRGGDGGATVSEAWRGRRGSGNARVSPLVAPHRVTTRLDGHRGRIRVCNCTGRLQGFCGNKILKVYPRLRLALGLGSGAGKIASESGSKVWQNGAGAEGREICPCIPSGYWGDRTHED